VSPSRNAIQSPRGDQRGGKLRAIEEAPITAGFLAEHDRLELLDAVPDRQEPRDVLLDELQRRHHMGDALTGEVLKIAGLCTTRSWISWASPWSWLPLTDAVSVLAA